MEQAALGRQAAAPANSTLGQARKRKGNGSTPPSTAIPAYAGTAVTAVPVALGTLQAATPAALVEQASAMATALAGVIEKQGLYTTLDGKRYVKVEGYTTLGVMLGVLPREVSVTEEWGVYTATVELVRMSDGAVLARASAECGDPDEVDRYGKPTWASRPRYARRSMALTRATGKAGRMAFSWIMAMSGYSTTPAEEMEGASATVRTVRTVSTVIDPLSPEQLAELRALIGRCTTESKFCAYLRIKGIAELPASRFDAACAALRQKIGRGVAP
jgi:hypothetical protein